MNRGAFSHIKQIGGRLRELQREGSPVSVIKDDEEGDDDDDEPISIDFCRLPTCSCTSI